MVIANDMDSLASVSAPEEKSDVSPTYVGTRDERAPGIRAAADDEKMGISHTYVGTSGERHTYANSDEPARTSRRVTIVRVTDDFGGRIEVRIGEALILGQLIDAVLEELRTKRANEG